VGQERFFRPRERREGRGGERFQGILKRTVRIAFQFLLLCSFLFVGHRVYVHLLEDPFFRVREVEVEGCQKIPRETILSLIQMERMPNLFKVKLKEVAKRLESHPWIDHVVVRKVFPNKVLIQIEERKPIAILQLGELYYIDATGVIFSPVEDGDGYNYPFLTGLTRQALERDPAETKDLVMKALELLRTVEKEKVSPLEKISEIHMEKTFGIYCFTEAEGIEVRMGWDHFGEKLKRLSILWSDLQKRGIAAASIDCSDLQRMVVKKIPQKIIKRKEVMGRWVRKIR
jgi:cell division septal protein FtsQ